MNNNRRNNNCYSGNYLRDFFNDRKNNNYPTYVIGTTGPTARCNKSSIYIFKW